MIENYTVKSVGVGKDTYAIEAEGTITIFLDKRYNMIPEAGDRIELETDSDVFECIVYFKINDKVVYDYR